MALPLRPAGDTGALTIEDECQKDVAETLPCETMCRADAAQKPCIFYGRKAVATYECELGRTEKTKPKRFACSAVKGWDENNYPECGTDTKALLLDADVIHAQSIPFYKVRQKLNSDCQQPPPSGSTMVDKIFEDETTSSVHDPCREYNGRTAFKVKVWRDAPRTVFYETLKKKDASDIYRMSTIFIRKCVQNPEVRTRAIKEMYPCIWKDRRGTEFLTDEERAACLSPSDDARDVDVGDVLHDGRYDQDISLRTFGNYDARNHHPQVISGEQSDATPLLIGGVVGASAVVIIMLIFCLGLAFGMIIYWGYSQRRALDVKRKKEEMHDWIDNEDRNEV
eukprot:823401_1